MSGPNESSVLWTYHFNHLVVFSALIFKHTDSFPLSETEVAALRRHLVTAGSAWASRWCQEWTVRSISTLRGPPHSDKARGRTDSAFWIPAYGNVCIAPHSSARWLSSPTMISETTEVIYTKQLKSGPLPCFFVNNLIKGFIQLASTTVVVVSIIFHLSPELSSDCSFWNKFDHPAFAQVPHSITIIDVCEIAWEIFRAVCSVDIDRKNEGFGICCVFFCVDWDRVSFG